MTWGALEVVLEHDVASSVDDASKEYNRFNEAFDALQWLLARTPKIGVSKKVDDVEWRLYAQSGDPLAGTPSIWVLYKCNKTQVTICAIQVIPNGEEIN